MSKWKVPLLMTKGQKRTLCPGTTIHLTMSVEAHMLGDDEDEPMPVMPVHWTVTTGDKTWQGNFDGEILIIPQDMPGEAKVPFIKILNEVYDLNDDEQMDDWWHDELKATWPPPRKTWIDKREE